jgi:L-amino acid N-acyltransferase YncA
MSIRPPWKELLENSAAEINCAKKSKLHTMIAVIDAENQSSVEFHMKKFGFKTVGLSKNPVINLIVGCTLSCN